MDFTVGERVTRKSYQHDLLFRIAKLGASEAVLHGEDIRLIADAPFADLRRVEERDLKKRKKVVRKQEEHSFKLFRQD